MGGGISIDDPGSPGPGGSVTRTKVGAGLGPPDAPGKPLGAGDAPRLEAKLAVGATGDAETMGVAPFDGGAPEELGGADPSGDRGQLAMRLPKTNRAATAASATSASPTARRWVLLFMRR